MSKTVEIEVQVNNNGDFTYTDTQTKGPAGKLKVKQRDADDFAWTCGEPAAILFDPATPFGSLHYANRDPRPGKLANLFFDADGKAPDKLARPGHFKYYVAVLHNNRIFIDDPEVVVDY